MASYIRLHIESLLMSWGIYAPLSNRRVFSYPTRSGVGGLLGAALGLQRGDSQLDTLHKNIRVHSRILREGSLKADNQNKKITFEGDLDPYKPEKTNPQTRRLGIVSPSMATKPIGRKISTREYITDGAFEVLVEVLEGCPFDPKSLIQALKRPKLPLYFGRKQCIPLAPIVTFSSSPLYGGDPQSLFRDPTVEDVGILMEIPDERNFKDWASRRYPDACKNMMCLDMRDRPSKEAVPVQVWDALYRTSGRVFFERTAWVLRGSQPRKPQEMTPWARHKPTAPA